MSEIMNLQRNRPCYSANREVADHLVIYLANNNHLIAVETYFGKIVCVERVSVAEMLVTRWLAGPDLPRIDDDFDGRPGRVFGSKLRVPCTSLKCPRT